MEALGGYPVVVKPNAQGSSVGVHIVVEASELEAALDDAFQYGAVLIEEFIPGREVTVAVLDGEALPVVEIIPEAGFYDYRHKYTKGQTRYVVPAELPAEVAAEVSRLGTLAFAALGCAGVARRRLPADPGESAVLPGGQHRSRHDGDEPGSHGGARARHQLRGSGGAVGCLRGSAGGRAKAVTGRGAWGRAAAVSR